MESIISPRRYYKDEINKNKIIDRLEITLVNISKNRNARILYGRINWY